MSILSSNWTIKLADYASKSPKSRMLFLGDIALARGVGGKIDQYGNDYNFMHVKEIFEEKSAVIFNLECCLTERGEPWEPKPVLMNGIEGYLNIFPQNVNYVANVANNHFLDLGVFGAQDTIDAVYKKGMGCFGATGSYSESFEHKVNLPSANVSLIAYSPAAHPFPANTEINVSYKSVCEMVTDVKKLRMTTDLLLVSLHQGVEFCRYTDKVSRKRAQALIDAGADCVICHHTHVIQGIERYKGKVIFYGIGNFLIDIDTKAMPNTKYSLSLDFVIQDKEIKEIKVIPFFINSELQVEYLQGKDKDRLEQEINWLSSFFSSAFFVQINYVLARALWVKLHLKSVANMCQRKGVVATIRYYFSRVFIKLLNK
ncbi:CapA family protein [Psychromonas arctica]|uniref:CapA family protein n=1 Tax=Psychromonas arctica TaxID=168275 RepID=UPI002FD68905